MANCTENAAPLKKWEKPVKRDANGRFERGSKPLPHAHRPKGSLNKTTVALKEMILNSLERLGGEEYLMKLAIENSSAYAGILSKVLPSTLAADDSNGGKGMQITFQRVIVYPDGRKEIEGATPKSLPAPEPKTDPASIA